MYVLVSVCMCVCVCVCVCVHVRMCVTGMCLCSLIMHSITYACLLVALLFLEVRIYPVFDFTV